MKSTTKIRILHVILQSLKKINEKSYSLQEVESAWFYYRSAFVKCYNVLNVPYLILSFLSYKILRAWFSFTNPLGGGGKHWFFFPTIYFPKTQNLNMLAYLFVSLFIYLTRRVSSYVLVHYSNAHMVELGSMRRAMNPVIWSLATASQNLPWLEAGIGNRSGFKPRHSNMSHWRYWFTKKQT